jgi:hypothetical protein
LLNDHECNLIHTKVLLGYVSFCARRSGPASRVLGWGMTPRTPRSAHGRTKLAGEQAVLSQLPYTGHVVRAAWLYGEHGPNFVRTMIRLEASQSRVDGGRPSFRATRKGQPRACGTQAPGPPAGPLAYPDTKSEVRKRTAGRRAPAINPNERSGLAVWLLIVPVPGFGCGVRRAATCPQELLTTASRPRVPAWPSQLVSVGTSVMVMIVTSPVPVSGIVGANHGRKQRREARQLLRFRKSFGVAGRHLAEALA